MTPNATVIGGGISGVACANALSRAGVRHVVVGGLAVNLQGVPRFTSDLDVAIAVDGGAWAGARAVREVDGRWRLDEEVGVETVLAPLRTSLRADA